MSAVLGMAAGGLNAVLGWAAYRYLGPIPFAIIEGVVIAGSLYGIREMLR